MNETQREALAVLGEVWSLAPDVRLGQLMAHLGFLGEAYLSRGLGYIDDDELLAILYRHREELQARLHGTFDQEHRSDSGTVSVSGSPMDPEPAAAGDS